MAFHFYALLTVLLWLSCLFEPFLDKFVELARFLDFGKAIVEKFLGLCISFLEDKAQPLIGEGFTGNF